MTKPNLTAVAPAATDLRQRAARARDAAGRFIKRTAPVELSIEGEPPAAAHSGEPDSAMAVATVFRASYDALARVLVDYVPDSLSDALSDAHGHAYDALRTARPTTSAGLRALAECWATVIEDENGGKTGDLVSDHAAAALIAGARMIDPLGHVATPAHQPPAQDVDWYDPPPGFMASPAIEPSGFVRIPEGISIEIGRLRGIAFAEFERQASARSTAEGEERLRGELHLDRLSKAADGCARSEASDGSLNLADLIDLKSAPLSDLLTVRDLAKCLSEVAYAFSWSGRCQGGRIAARRFVTSLGDALTAVESAVEQEVEGRATAKPDDRKTRLYMLAPSVIGNDDPEELAAFARDLLDHATAQQEGR